MFPIIMVHVDGRDVMENFENREIEILQDFKDPR